jgi:hypothetical protein
MSGPGGWAQRSDRHLTTGTWATQGMIPLPSKSVPVWTPASAQGGGIGPR